ncbi:MAG: ABC transporter permease [Nocardiopsaceae bacterium]|jgi:peptide/nickel transport system permease protein|nr:ABC transporter permease [Nocardiopsaceae bacterium]
MALTTWLGRRPPLLRAGAGEPRDKLDAVAAITGCVCAGLLVAAIFAPLIAPYRPDAIDALAINQGPTAAHLLGTDSLGRDVLSRLLYGARLSLLGPALVTVLSTTLGTAIAIAGSWLGGTADRLMARFLDILFAFPSILIAVLAVIAFGTGLTAPVIALSVAYTPYIARVIRSAAVHERQLPYIEACQLLGFSSYRTAINHLLRNVRLLIIAQATITFGYALLDLAAISFIGLGVQPPTADWGVMVSEGSSSLINGYLSETLAAGAAIVLTVVAFNVLGERLATRSQGKQ